MIKTTDQLYRLIELEAVPKRIVSLVPSITELLHDLGLEEEVAGITPYCIKPSHWGKEKLIVGGPQGVDFDKINQIQPDIIFVSKEENAKEEIAQLMKNYPVWVADCKNLNDAADMILTIGEITDRQYKANQLVHDILNNFQQNCHSHRGRVVYLIWKAPWMTVNKSTFISDILKRCGFENAIEGKEENYPVISLEAIQEIEAEYVFLSSEPYPFNDKHAKQLRKLLPGKEVKLVDGEMCSWYGSHLLKVPAYFKQLS